MNSYNSVTLKSSTSTAVSASIELLTKCALNVITTRPDHELEEDDVYQLFSKDDM